MLSRFPKINHALVWLLLIPFLLVVRVWYVSAVPPHAFTQDEAAILLNAQLLAETGQDEWQSSWPLVYRSFGDSKLPGYLYSVLLAGEMWRFEWITVRIPSLLAGALLPLAVWWLVRSCGGTPRTAWIASGLLIASPWSWHYGTTGYEAHLALLLWVMSLALLLRRSAAWWSDFLATGLLVISILTYNAPLLLLPALLAAVVWWRWGNRVAMVRAGVLIAAAGLLGGGLTLSASSQKGGISILQDPTLNALYPEYRAQFPVLLQTLLGNKWVYYGKLVVARWLASWSWSFLVIRGGANPWHTIPGTGHLNGSVLVLLGLYLPVWLTRLGRRGRNRTQWRAAALLLWLTLTATLPAIITVDAPHATRSLFFFVMLSILAAFSLSSLTEIVNSEFPAWGRRVFVLALGFVLFWMTLLWVNPAQVRWQYFVSPRWNTGLIEVLESPQVQQAEVVYVVDAHSTLSPYVGVIDAQARADFHGSVTRSAPDVAGLVRVEELGKYRFVYAAEDVPASVSGVLLQPRSNREWDIIEL